MTRERLSMHLLILLMVDILTIPVFASVNTYHSTNRVVIPGAFTSIQKALEAVSNGSEVAISKGSFTEYILIRKPVKLYGLEDVRLYGSIKVLDTANVSIDGFTIIIVPPGTEFGMTILDSSNVVIEDVTFIGAGIIVYNSEHITIRRCRFVDVAGPAIRILGSSKNIVIEWNDITNAYVGLFVEEGETITFRYNNISAKDLAVLLHKNAKNVTIYMNNFVNTKVEDYGINNTWYEPKLKLGNFWSNLGGTDTNSDKVLDIPIYIGNKILDPYPLATHFHEYLNMSNSGKRSIESTPIRGIYNFTPYFLLAVVVIIVIMIIALSIRKRSLI